MTLKTLGAIAILSTALASPVFAQEAGPHGRSSDGPAYRLRHFRGAYNQAPLNRPYDTGFSGRRVFLGEGPQDAHSFPGGADPDLNPPGN